MAPLFGLVLDRTGDDYGFAFRAFFVLYVVAFLLVFALRIPERGPDDAARPVEPANG